MRQPKDPRYFYNPHGQVTRLKDANGRQKHWVYDAATDWLTATTDALGAAPGDPGHSIFYDRDVRGRAIRERDAAGDTVDYAYDGNRRLRTITQQDAGAALITRLAHDGQGRLATIQDPTGKKTIFRYDEAGRLYESLREALPAETLRFGTMPPGIWSGSPIGTRHDHLRVRRVRPARSDTRAGLAGPRRE